MFAHFGHDAYLPDDLIVNALLMLIKVELP